MSEYGVIILGGTGQVGGAVVEAFLASPRCREVVLLSRRPAATAPAERVRTVVVDTDSAGFEAEVASLVSACAPRAMLGVSCVGVGAGSGKWSEDDLMKLEVGVVGAFARGCKAGGVGRFGLLTAAGSNPKSSIRYARVMGRKEETVAAVGFAQLAIFRPGIIGGNVHTPRWVDLLGRALPGSWGTIDQSTIGRAFVTELERDGVAATAGPTILHNAEMRAAVRG